MLKSYEAIYDHGHIHFLGESPRFNRLSVVLVADDESELDQTQPLPQPTSNSTCLVELLHSVPLESRTQLAEKCGGIAPIASAATRLSDSQADALLLDTCGAWGTRTLDEIDSLLAKQRHQDWV